MEVAKEMGCDSAIQLAEAKLRDARAERDAAKPPAIKKWNAIEAVQKAERLVEVAKADRDKAVQAVEDAKKEALSASSCYKGRARGGNRVGHQGAFERVVARVGAKPRRRRGPGSPEGCSALTARAVAHHVASKAQVAEENHPQVESSEQAKDNMDVDLPPAVDVPLFEDGDLDGLDLGDLVDSAIADYEQNKRKAAITDLLNRAVKRKKGATPQRG